MYIQTIDNSLKDHSYHNELLVVAVVEAFDIELDN
jgi:hypothetical protein